MYLVGFSLADEQVWGANSVTHTGFPNISQIAWMSLINNLESVPLYQCTGMKSILGVGNPDVKFCNQLPAVNGFLHMTGAPTNPAL